MKESHPILFWTAFFGVFFWIYLCHILIRTIKNRHPEKFESMGRPAVIMRSTYKSTFAFVLYFVRSEWKELGDSELTSLSKIMSVYFILLMSVFGYLVWDEFAKYV